MSRRSKGIRRAVCKAAAPRLLIKKSLRRVSVLGSGKVREKDSGYRQAVQLGQALAQGGWTVFHGGFRGVMEAVAKGSRLAGGRNVGVTILRNGDSPSKNLKGTVPLNNPWIDAEIKMPCWQSRLFRLIEVGDAYIFLDGATGTLTELFVVLEMTNRGLLRKPIVILGKKLGSLLHRLKKDPHFDLPPQVVFAGSISQVVQLMKRTVL